MRESYPVVDLTTAEARLFEEHCLHLQLRQVNRGRKGETGSKTWQVSGEPSHTPRNPQKPTLVAFWWRACSTQNGGIRRKMKEVVRRLQPPKLSFKALGFSGRIPLPVVWDRASTTAALNVRISTSSEFATCLDQLCSICFLKDSGSCPTMSSTTL